MLELQRAIALLLRVRSAPQIFKRRCRKTVTLSGACFDLCGQFALFSVLRAILHSPGRLPPTVTPASYSTTSSSIHLAAVFDDVNVKASNLTPLSH